MRACVGIDTWIELKSMDLNFTREKERGSIFIWKFTINGYLKNFISYARGGGGAKKSFKLWEGVKIFISITPLLLGHAILILVEQYHGRTILLILCRCLILLWHPPPHPTNTPKALLTYEMVPIIDIYIYI